MLINKPKSMQSEIQKLFPVKPANPENAVFVIGSVYFYLLMAQNSVPLRWFWQFYKFFNFGVSTKTCNWRKVNFKN